MLKENLEHYQFVQSCAKQVLQEITNYIKPGLTEADIRGECINLFKKFNIEKSWYHNIMACVLIGDRTVLSTSGRNYQANNETQIRMDDLITIDVSPLYQTFWGDCSRSYVVRNGRVYLDVPSGLEELDLGVKAEIDLHQFLKKIAKPSMKLSELYIEANKKIVALGYENLDFKGNLGHSIEKELSERKFIEKSDNAHLDQLSLFTFEPHICKPGQKCGFKRENIYYFDGDELIEL